jgi:hypothetical protein
MFDYASRSVNAIAHLLGETDEFAWSRQHGLFYVFRDPGSNICMVTARIPGRNKLVRELDRWCTALRHAIPAAQILEAECGRVCEGSDDVEDVTTIWFRVWGISPAPDTALH